MDSYHIARFAALIGDPTRSIMLTHLLDGRAHTAGELSRCANVSPSTASGHLAKLLDAGLLSHLKQGRHVYYRLANGEVAEALESLARLQVVPRHPHAHVAPGDRKLVAGRSCYDHLAGRLGVALANVFLIRGLMAMEEERFLLTRDGKRFLRTWRIDCDALACGKRPLIKPCLDWTERRFHLGGAVAAAVFDHICACGWLSRESGTRAVALTASGRRELQDQLGLADEIDKLGRQPDHKDGTCRSYPAGS